MLISQQHFYFCFRTVPYAMGHGPGKTGAHGSFIARSAEAIRDICYLGCIYTQYSGRDGGPIGFLAHLATSLVRSIVLEFIINQAVVIHCIM